MENAKYVDVDGVRTRYFEGGSGEVLVLISGGTYGTYYNAYHWSMNFGGLCEHFHVYAFDKFGLGFTDHPTNDESYLMGPVIDHAKGFLRTMGIDRASLVGHSRGALPAARIAVDHPGLVKALVVLGSSTLPAEDPSTPVDFYKDLEQGAPPIPDRDYVCREAHANSYSKAHITEDFVDALLEVALLPTTIESKKKMEHLLDAQFLPDMRERKYETLDLIKDGRLKAPTLIIWGLNDPSAPFKLGLDLFQLISSVVHRTQLHAFNHAGHYVYREHPEELNRLIVDFVNNT
jgi:2-hydroxy-6-oxonona-2,4-dienedioate hydrolase